MRWHAHMGSRRPDSAAKGQLPAACASKQVKLWTAPLPRACQQCSRVQFHATQGQTTPPDETKPPMQCSGTRSAICGPKVSSQAVCKHATKLVVPKASRRGGSQRATFVASPRHRRRAARPCMLSSLSRGSGLQITYAPEAWHKSHPASRQRPLAYTVQRKPTRSSQPRRCRALANGHLYAPSVHQATPGGLAAAP